jgi:hypothetical protein
MRSLRGFCLILLLAPAGACGGADGDGARQGERDAAPAGDDDAGVDSGAGAAGGGAGAAGPDVDCDAEPIPAFTEVAIFEKCVGCHGRELTGDARMGATLGVNFDDHASAAEHAERAALYVFHGIMPPVTTNIAVTDAEKEQLYLWALCGTPD